MGTPTTPTAKSSTIKQIIIFSVIIMIVIFSIIVIYKLYNQAEKKIQWPKVISRCPDYWVDLGKGNCKNVHNLGTCTKNQIQPTVKFDKSYYDGTDIDNDPMKNSGKIKRCRWAKNCKVPWEGIDNLCA